MALDKPALKTEILDILYDLSMQEDNPEGAREEFATRLSNAINTFVKSGTVNVTVSTTGTATAQTGTGTGSVS